MWDRRVRLLAQEDYFFEGHGRTGEGGEGGITVGGEMGGEELTRWSRGFVVCEEREKD